MRIPITPTALAVSVLFVSSPRAEAQQRRPGGPGPGAPVSAVAHLLEHADSLGLSGAQRDELQGLQDRLVEESAPALDALRELRESNDRGNLRARARPLMEELRALDQDAPASAVEVLDENQRARAEALVADLHDRRRHRGRRGPGPENGRRRRFR